MRWLALTVLALFVEGIVVQQSDAGDDMLEHPGYQACIDAASHLELFTSEALQLPAADGFLKRLDDQAAWMAPNHRHRRARRYWNRLGWTDRLSGQ